MARFARLAATVALIGSTALGQGLVLSGETPAPRPTRRDPGPPLSMGAHKVEAVIGERVANVTVEQVFLNRTSRELEGIYLFPLPPQASVSNFAMTMGGRMVEGEVIEAGKARAIYESIVRRRRDPGLLEFVGRGLFRARVFPIPARGTVKVRIRYQQVLDEDAGTLRFRYPLATDRLNRGPVGSVLIDVRYSGEGELRSLYCPSHEIDVVREGTRAARITHESTAKSQDRDFALYIHRSDETIGFSLLSDKPVAAEGTFLAVLAPRRDPETIVPKDVVYVLDRSGSMQGRKIFQARAAVKHGISLLREGDRFNVISFATDGRVFRQGLVEASEETRNAAALWIDRQEPSGGTALHAALGRAQDFRIESSGRLFLVVLITDGRPTVGLVDADEILKNLGGSARVFTFGVGYDLDVKLLDRIAEATGGRRDYVAPSERIDEVTGRFFVKIDQPVLTDVSLGFGPGISQVYPRRVRDLFAGDQIVVMGRYDKPGPTSITLRGRSAGTESIHTYEAELRANPGPDYLARLWAQRKVAFLLDEIRLHGGNTELVDEVIALATRFSIVTPYTSGLVVEDVPQSIRTFRGPSGGAVPPGLREPSDREPPPPPAGPAGPNTPGFGPRKRLVFASKKLKEQKEESTAASQAHVKDAAGKTFRRDARGRWTDTAWDGKQEPERIEAYSVEYFDLIEKDQRIAKYLAVGERVLFLFAGKVYEVVPDDPQAG